MDIYFLIANAVAIVAILAFGILLISHINLNKNYKDLLQSSSDLNAKNLALEADAKYKNSVINEQKARYEKDLSDLSANLGKFYENTLEKAKAELINLNAQKISQSSNELVSQALQNEIKPLREEIEKYSKENVKLNAVFTANFDALSKMASDIGQKTAELTNALRGNKKIAGNWGESQLDLVLENSGLKQGQNYEKQVYYTDDEGKKRFLDVVVDFGVGKKAVIDAKCSLVHYIDYANANSDEERARASKELAKDVKNHIDILAPKDYQKYSKEAYDYVFMFIPNENILQAAMQSDQGLYQYAYEKGIFLTTPLTMLMALRTVYLCWQNLKIDDNSRKILKLAGDLYDKVYGFALDFDTIERNIATLSKTYDNAKNKLSAGKGNVIKRIEDLKRLGAKTNKSINIEYDDEKDILDEFSKDEIKSKDIANLQLDEGGEAINDEGFLAPQNSDELLASKGEQDLQENEIKQDLSSDGNGVRDVLDESTKDYQASNEEEKNLEKAQASSEEKAQNMQDGVQIALQSDVNEAKNEQSLDFSFLNVDMIKGEQPNG